VTVTEAEIIAALSEAARDVLDPETGLNVVDMGLILKVGYAAEDRRAEILMTFTTPGCPSGDIMVFGLEQRLAMVEGVESVAVEVTFDEPWSPDWITPEGRAALGWR